VAGSALGRRNRSGGVAVKRRRQGARWRAALITKSPSFYVTTERDGIRSNDSGQPHKAVLTYAMQPANPAEGQALIRRAFTVIELTVTVCILCVLSAIAMPLAGKLQTVTVSSITVNARRINACPSAGLAGCIAYVRTALCGCPESFDRIHPVPS